MFHTHTNTSAEEIWRQKRGSKLHGPRTTIKSKISKKITKKKTTYLSVNSTLTFTLEFVSRGSGWVHPLPAGRRRNNAGQWGRTEKIASKTKQENAFIVPLRDSLKQKSSNLTQLALAGMKTQKFKKDVCFLCLSITIQVCYLLFRPKNKTKKSVASSDCVVYVPTRVTR